MEKQLEDMDKAGVEKAILKIPCCHTWLSLEMCKKFNDGLAKHVKEGKGRFAALAVVPPYGGKEAIYGTGTVCKRSWNDWRTDFFPLWK